MDEETGNPGSEGDDLRSQLENAFKTAEAAPVTETPPAEAAVEPQPTEAEKAQRARDEQGRFAKTDKQPEKAAAPAKAQTEIPPEADKPEATQEAKPAAIEAPASWNAQGREMFAKADPKLREYILQRDQEQAAGVAKLKEQYEGKAKFAESMWAEVAPYEAMIRAEGGTPQSAVKSLLGMAYIMRTGTPQQKQQLLLKTAQDFGVDLGAPLPEQQRLDPTVDALQREIATLKQELGNWRNQQESERQSSILSEIEQFKANHPHFEAVRVTMGRLLDTGEAKDLEDAYDKAVWANPELRAQLLKEQQEKAEKDRAEKAKAEAARAKAASVSIAGAPGNAGNGAGKAPASSIRAELEQQFYARA